MNEKHSLIDTCSFCSEFNNQIENNYLKMFLGEDVENRILTQTENFFVLPSLGQIVDGYLLVLPKAHYLSFGHLPKSLIKEYQDLKQEVCSVLTTEYGVSPLMFEHGPISESKRGGCCVDHAHMHFMPVSMDLLPTLKMNFTGHRIASLYDLCEQVTRQIPYLYYEDERGEGYVFDAPDIPSQYLRRLVAEKLNLTDMWNWVVFPEIERVKASLNRLRRVWR